MGPGIVGTASRLGFSGIEVGPVLDAAAGLGGVPIVCLRVSFADTAAPPPWALASQRDPRSPSQPAGGYCHPVPCVGGDEERTLRSDLATSGLAERHDLVDVAPVGVVDLLAEHDLAVVSMDRPRAGRSRVVRSGGGRGRGRRESPDPMTDAPSRVERVLNLLALMLDTRSRAPERSTCARSPGYPSQTEANRRGVRA